MKTTMAVPPVRAMQNGGGGSYGAAPAGMVPVFGAEAAPDGMGQVQPEAGIMHSADQYGPPQNPMYDAAPGMPPIWRRGVVAADPTALGPVWSDRDFVKDGDPEADEADGTGVPVFGGTVDGKPSYGFGAGVPVLGFPPQSGGPRVGSGTGGPLPKWMERQGDVEVPGSVGSDDPDLAPEFDVEGQRVWPDRQGLPGGHRALLIERQRLRERRQQDQLRLAAERERLDAEDRRLRMVGATAAQYETQLRNLGAASAGRSPDSPQARRYEEVQDALQRWHGEHPEYREARAAYNEQLGAIDEREQAEEDRRGGVVSLMSQPAAAARVGEILAATRPSSAARDANVDGSSVVALAHAQDDGSDTGLAAASLQALAELRRRGIQTVSGRPIGEVTAEVQQWASEKQAPKTPPVEKNFFKNIVSAVERGWQQFELSEAMDERDPKKVAEIARKLAQMPESDALQRWSKGQYNLEALPQMFVESMAAYLPAWAVRVPKYAGIGAGIGAAAGLVGGPFAEVTVPGGALAGAEMGAMNVASGMASLALESSGKMIDVLSDKGVDVTDPKALGEAFANQALMDEVRIAGLKKGIPIALIDGATAGLGGGAAKGLKLLPAMLHAAKHSAIGGAFGAGGELASEIVAGEKIDVPSIAAEGAVEFMGIGEPVLSSALSRIRANLGKADRGARAARLDTFARINEELKKTQAKAASAREAGDVAGALEEGQADQNLQSTLHDVATSELHSVPDATRGEIAGATGEGVDFQDEEERLDGDPAVHFATVAIGGSVREAYAPEGAAQRVERIARENNVSPSTAQRIFDQHLAMRAAADLQRVLDGQRLAPAKEQALVDAGLVHVERAADGGTRARITDDAVPLLPEGMRQHIAADAGAFPNLEVTPDAPGNGWASLVAAGRQRVAADFAREQGAGMRQKSAPGGGAGGPARGEAAGPEVARPGSQGKDAPGKLDPRAFQHPNAKVRNLAKAWQRLHEILAEGRELSTSQRNVLRTAEAVLKEAGMLGDERDLHIGGGDGNGKISPFNPAQKEENCAACVAAFIQSILGGRPVNAEEIEKKMQTRLGRGGTQLPTQSAALSYIARAAQVRIGARPISGAFAGSFAIPLEKGDYVLIARDHVMIGRVLADGTRVIFDPQVDAFQSWGTVTGRYGRIEAFRIHY